MVVGVDDTLAMGSGDHLHTPVDGARVVQCRPVMGVRATFLSRSHFAQLESERRARRVMHSRAIATSDTTRFEDNDSKVYKERKIDGCEKHGREVKAW